MIAGKITEVERSTIGALANTNIEKASRSLPLSGKLLDLHEEVWSFQVLDADVVAFLEIGEIFNELLSSWHILVAQQTRVLLLLMHILDVEILFDLIIEVLHVLHEALLHLVALLLPEILLKIQRDHQLNDGLTC